MDIILRALWYTVQAAAAIYATVGLVHLTYILILMILGQLNE